MKATFLFFNTNTKSPAPKTSVCPRFFWLDAEEENTSTEKYPFFLQRETMPKTIRKEQPTTCTTVDQPQIFQQIVNINITNISNEAGMVKNLLQDQGEVDPSPCTRCLSFKKSPGKVKDLANFYCDVGMKAVLRSLRKVLIRNIDSSSNEIE